MSTKLYEKQLKVLVKESVREAIDSRFMKFRALFLPFVSSKEQKEIEQLYKKPSRKIARYHQIEI